MGNIINMKIRNILFIAFCFLTINANAQVVILKNDTVAIKKIINIKYMKYIGKEVTYLLKQDYIKDYESYSFRDEPPGMLQGIELKLSNNFYVRIIVQKCQYVKNPDFERKWDFDLFKKEKVSKIIFIYEDKVVKAY